MLAHSKLMKNDDGTFIEKLENGKCRLEKKRRMLVHRGHQMLFFEVLLFRSGKNVAVERKIGALGNVRLLT